MEGAKGELYIPPHLGYSDHGSSSNRSGAETAPIGEQSPQSPTRSEQSNRRQPLFPL